MCVLYVMYLMYRFQFFQTGLINKVLESIGMEHFNGLPTPTKVEAPLGDEDNSYESKRDWNNSYAYVIGMMLYLSSNTRQDVSFSIHQCARFIHNTKASCEVAVKRIYWYLQITKDKGLLFNLSKKLVVDFYDDAGFAVLWGYENPQERI